MRQLAFEQEQNQPTSRVIISICDFTGEWSRPYREAGYKIYQIDPKLHDRKPPAWNDGTFGRVTFYGITAQEFAELELDTPCQGILMAPPCTHFTVSGAQYWPEKDRDGRTAAALEIIDACLAVKNRLQPNWWALENPVGRLPKLRPDELGPPRMYFHPCDYGDPYTKKTGLWGEFNTALPQNRVEPERVCSQGSWLMKLGGKSEKTKELRSITPPGFARAFFETNP